MKQLQSLGNAFAAFSSLPSEALPRNPVVEVFGYRRVFVENHQGIGEYSSCKIIINASYGQICVTGQQLELAEMTKSSLVVTGFIDCVNLIRK